MNNSVHSTSVIVIIDNEPQVGTIFQHILQEIVPTHKPVFTQYGAEALDLVRSRPVPLIITDYQIADMDGIQITRAAKQLAPTIRVVALTGEPDTRVRQEFYKAGVDFFLAKPIALAQLIQVVHQALDSRLERHIGQ